MYARINFGMGGVQLGALGASAVSAVLGQGPAEPPNLPPVGAPVAPAAVQEAVVWNAPPQCPVQATVEASIAELAGRVPLAEEIRIRAEVQRRVEDWELRLTTATGRAPTTREQVFHADTCESLADATALLVAVLMDPVATAGTVARRTAPVVRPPQLERETEPGPPPPRTPAPTTATSPRPNWSFGVQLGVGGEYQAVPRGTGGARLSLFAQRPGFELRLAGSYWLPRRTEGTDQPGAVVQLGTAELSPCWVPTTGRLQFPICAGVEAGGIRGDGIDVDRARGPTIAWLAATVGPGIRWWVRPRVALVADLQGYGALLRAQLTLGDDAEVLHEPSTLGFRGLVGLSIGLSAFPAATSENR